jgi:PIN domain nuclease of toxin-antitoxin system
VEPELPGDPADRLIVATALDKRVSIVTRDARIRQFAGVATVWG